MAIRLYVGNLPYEVNEERLREMFSPFGTVVTATVIINKFNNQSKGFAFVEFADDASAREAIDKLNGTEFEGRKLVVNEARPREENTGGGGFSGNRSGGFQRSRPQR